VLKVETSRSKRLNHYLGKIHALLTNDSGTIEKAILPTVFDIYSYPDEPLEKVHSKNTERN